MSKEKLFAADELRDIALCGRSLSQPGPARFAEEGAHEPTPTPYFILEDLFAHLEFDAHSHLLDVGCGTGRVLAYFAEAGFPGCATGVELDPELAAYAQSWTRRFPQLSVEAGSALDVPLARFTHFYLFNPFDTDVLLKFLAEIEGQVQRPVTLVHQSDNGETYFYAGRPGWSLLCQGEFQYACMPKGRKVRVYDCPQHFSIWRFEPL